jgi:hypothetical protein
MHDADHNRWALEKSATHQLQLFVTHYTHWNLTILGKALMSPSDVILILFVLTLNTVRKCDWISEVGTISVSSVIKITLRCMFAF